MINCPRTARINIRLFIKILKWKKENSVANNFLFVR